MKIEVAGVLRVSESGRRVADHRRRMEQDGEYTERRYGESIKTAYIKYPLQNLLLQIFRPTKHIEIFTILLLGKAVKCISNKN